MRILPSGLISQRVGGSHTPCPLILHEVLQQKTTDCIVANVYPLRIGCALWSAVTLYSECHNDFVDYKSYTKQRMMHDEVVLYAHDIGLQTKRTRRLTSLPGSLFV